MKWYSEIVFPFLCNRAMARKEFEPYRISVLSRVQGNILEIGFGSGLNLPHYPGDVQKLVAIDVCQGMVKQAEPQIQASPIQVDYQILHGESLPVSNDTFDTVVSSWTLCSILNIGHALQEIHRVLKPGGTFRFIEHGLSHNDNIARWQHRLTPIQRIIGGGCHLNRNIKALLASHPFTSLEVNEFDAPEFPKLAMHMYQGIATK